MKYGDFASLVQLGVGLHIGTALLQLYGELGVQPIVRSIARMRSLFTDDAERPSKALEGQLDKLESDFEIFKIHLFNEFKWYVKLNAIIATILVMVLIFLAYAAGDDATLSSTIIIVAVSILPAPVTLAVLWYDSAREAGPLLAAAKALEARMMGSHAS